MQIFGVGKASQVEQHILRCVVPVEWTKTTNQEILPMVVENTGAHSPPPTSAGKDLATFLKHPHSPNTKGQGDTNFPFTNSPCLMSWHEVKTLFHEMGHAIHSMIVRTSYHNVSGTRSTTDFVKLPSILMEHFVQSPQVVSIVARHHKTGANLAFEHLDSHSQAFNSLKGLDTYRQILLARIDQITYYTYLSERVIASKIRDELFAPNPLSMQAGGVFKFKCLKYCGGNDFWQMLADVVEAENVRDGDSKSMDEAGKWGIE
uniref:Mitochondrial intermediate peptidase n=1 Tax=Melanopsichium pennsylvanicum 4 TaxID=1398559 RepID=A0A077RAX2_9BASI|nr:mitochondrial intermediate peptidase [Melanopsichium pennsylvanicum 4]